MECSLVIRAYNEEINIGRLLEGVFHQSVRDVEIILVDSGSTDATVAIAEQYGAVIIQIPPLEFTFGRSLNFGLAATTRELVVIASAHVYPVYPDWLECLLEPFEDLRVSLTYGKQSGNETSNFSEKQVFSHWYPDQSYPAQPHPFCNNANAAIRRSVWEQNPYDETLTGLEDLAWAKRALEDGFIIAYAANAEVIHLHNETPLRVANRYRREAMAFKRLYPEAHFSLYDFFRLVSANISSDLWHSLKERVFWKSVASILWFRWMQFWGTYQGYRLSVEWNWQLRQTFYYPYRSPVAKKTDPRQVEPIRYNK
jgi:rhamnosyltransferase